METRSVKFNLKNFLEEYIFCIESNDEEEQMELIKEFESFIDRSSLPVIDGISRYIVKYETLNRYPKILELAQRCDSRIRPMGTTF